MNDSSTVTRLDLGAGAKREDGYLALDVSPYFRPDIQAAAALLPFADGAFTEVRCHHVLEHMERRDLVPAMNEMWRVLKVGGIADIEIPCYPYVEAIADPTHLQVLHSATFDYFIQCRLGGQHDHGAMDNRIPCFENQRRLYGIQPWLYHRRTLSMKGGAIRRVWLERVEETAE